MSFEADEVIHPMVKCIKIREKGTEERFGRKLIKSDTPKMLCNDCLELVFYIMSHIADCKYKLDGEVPETIMSGKTSNIFQFCEFEWSELVIF